MPDLFRYKVRDRAGELISGSIRGENIDAVESYLESIELTPIDVTPYRPISLRQILRIGASKAKLEDLILVTRKLTTLYRAGLPLIKSLEIIADQYEESPLGRALLSVRDDLERGEVFSDALARHPTIFRQIFVESVRAAEAAGKLDIVLDRLSEALEHELVTREEVKKALRYPLMVVGAIAVAVAVLTVFVIPKFAQFYGQYGANLPTPTRILIGISEFARTSWYIILIVVAASLWGVARALRIPGFRERFDGFLLSLPIFGALITKSSLSRFAHLLSVLVASGTPLIQSLSIVQRAVGNVVIGDEIGKFAESLREGRSLEECKHYMKHFPKLAISLVHVGLETGTLDLTLNEISRFFDREVRYASSRLTSALEPILIVIMGSMVLFLALSIFLPMWGLISVFR